MNKHIKNQKIVYINLAQDQITAKVDHLTIHGKPIDLIKIPEGSNIATLHDTKLYPNEINNYSKIYFSAHGREELVDCVLDRNNEHAKIYTLEDIAAYFAHAFRDNIFKNASTTPRLTLLMSVCEGAGFAKNLQKKLHDDYGIYIDVVANKYVVHEVVEHIKNKKTANIAQKTTSFKGFEREHKRPHSKVLFLINEKGQQFEIDAYQFKWIEKVANTLSTLLSNFVKWADMNNPENIAIWKGITILCNDINAIIAEPIHESTSLDLVANNLLAIIMSCQNKITDTHYKEAMKYDLLKITIAGLIREGKKYINPNSKMLAFLNHTENIKLQEEAASDDKSVLNLFQTKHRLSVLLNEASHGIDEELSKEIQKTMEHITELKNISR